jgi:hypothetical protein
MIGDCEHEWIENKDLLKGKYRCINCFVLSNLNGEDYLNFLKSKQWQEIRNERFIVDSFGCQDCGEMATVIHHLNYSNIININTMISLCKECHIERHLKENNINI